MMEYLKLPELVLALFILMPVLYALTHLLLEINPLLAMLVYFSSVLLLGIWGFRIIDES